MQTTHIVTKDQVDDGCSFYSNHYAEDEPRIDVVIPQGDVRASEETLTVTVNG
jgi:hypothetical protein